MRPHRKQESGEVLTGSQKFLSAEASRVKSSNWWIRELGGIQVRCDKVWETPTWEKPSIQYLTHYIMKSRTFYYVLPFYNCIADIRMICVFIRSCFPQTTVTLKVQIKVKKGGLCFINSGNNWNHFGKISSKTLKYQNRFGIVSSIVARYKRTTCASYDKINWA